jgi:hypothetical protein
VDELVKGWKRVMKTRVRDREVGEETPAAREIRRLKKELEGEETGEIAEALCGQEGLVPVGRKWVIVGSNRTVSSQSTRVALSQVSGALTDVSRAI